MKLSLQQKRLLIKIYNSAFDEPLEPIEIITAKALEIRGLCKMRKNYRWIEYNKSAKWHADLTEKGIEKADKL